MSGPLWQALTARVAHAFVDCQPQALDDDEAEEVGRFWFAVAEGKVSVN